MSENDKTDFLNSIIEPAPQGTDASRSINALYNVKLDVQVILGNARMPISQLLHMARGSVIELDKRMGEPVDVMINDRVVARGNLVKVGEHGMGVTLTEIVEEFKSLA